jgi:uncharacterized membrane protein YoaK (UPF0700 family)
MSTGKLVLASVGLIVVGAVLGAALGQLFPGSGILFIAPMALCVGIAVRLFAKRHLDKHDRQ